MELLLVRHAHAGARERWAGDDRLRPLSARGRADARALVPLLVPYSPARILSSPLVRCVQTVEPLALRLGIDIEESSLLLPDAGARAKRLIRKLAAGQGRVVVCTHGETIDDLQRAYARDRIRSRSRGFRPGDPHEKGSVWLLRFRDGLLDEAHYLPPARSGDRVLAPVAGRNR